MQKTASKSRLNNTLVPKGRTLYFNEEFHKYTDDLETIYTSTTTVIGKYYEQFSTKQVDIAIACERIGKNPNHLKYLRYRGKTTNQILYEWSLSTIEGCEKGTKKHNYLEDKVKTANGYHLNANGFIDGKIYTVDNIIVGHNYGKLSIKFFIETGIRDKYPTIFSLIVEFVNKGFSIYAEIGVYHLQLMVSGLIDILFVRGDEFLILDWKTNKAPIRFESGYYEKDNDGRLLLDKFIKQDKWMYHPISNLPDSIGTHYTLQLSIYDYLVESFGLKCLGNILCHIRTVESDNIYLSKDEQPEEVSFLPIKYLKSDVERLLAHHVTTVSPPKNLFNQ